MGDTIIPESRQEVGKQKSSKFLFGPVIDFLGLGGLSLIAIVLLFPIANFETSPLFNFIFFSVILSAFINYPHFAHSYQIFYRQFRRKIGPETIPSLRYRYWFAGIIVPIAMGGYLLSAYLKQNGALIGYAVNAMTFLVGWHYVKQGYGMLSVDAVLKKKFFTNKEKKLLIWHAYAGWMYMWIRGNKAVSEEDYFGLSYYTLNVPDWFLTIASSVLIVFAACVAFIFARRLSPGQKGLPFNGVMAYLTSIYIWLIFRINPLFGLFIPAFHSLQYLTVVGRFQHNVESDGGGAQRTPILSRFISSNATARLLKFYLFGVTLGALAFLLVPLSLSQYANFDRAQFGPFLPAIAIWLFINIHHYFLDNVMWRKGNPDVGKHLFAQTR